MVSDCSSINITIVNNDIAVWDNICCRGIANLEMVCRRRRSEHWRYGSCQGDEAGEIGSHDYCSMYVKILRD